MGSYHVIQMTSMADFRCNKGQVHPDLFLNLIFTPSYPSSSHIQHGCPRRRPRESPTPRTTASVSKDASTDKRDGIGDIYLQTGVLTGDNVRKLFDYAKQNKVRIIHAYPELVVHTDDTVRHPCESLL